jgi:hypothetical protein
MIGAENRSETSVQDQVDNNLVAWLAEKGESGLMYMFENNSLGRVVIITVAYQVVF